MKAIITALTIALAVCSTATAQQRKISSDRWVLRSDKPAQRWEDAFVTGNGRHGTMVMGRTGNECITCVHEEIFLRNWDRKIVGVPDIAKYLPKMRQFIANGENDKEGFVYAKAMEQAKEMGAEKVWECTPHPAFDLCIDYPAAGKPGSYSNQLDLETGDTWLWTTALSDDGHGDYPWKKIPRKK